MYIDQERWSELLKKPDWYFDIVPEWQVLREKAKSISEDEKNKLADEVYGFFEEKLKDGAIALGNEAGNWDKERKSIDTIVIHHTEIKPGLTKERLSALELIRLYATYYAKPYDARDTGISGQPISSGHVREGKQVFWPYHWIVRMDGSVERLLKDNEIGWHAGNWDINCRSIAIVLDNNYLSSRPDDGALRAVADLIRSEYGHVPKERIYGHKEVRLNGPTSCPSGLFLSQDGQRGWKEDLLELI